MMPVTNSARLLQDGFLLGDFSYDWQGLRVRKATPSAIVRYVYDGLAPLLVTNDTGRSRVATRMGIPAPADIEEHNRRPAVCPG